MRAKLIRITPQVLVNQLKSGEKPKVICDGLPEDTEFVTAHILGDYSGHETLQLIVTSPSFAEVPEGHAIPEVRPTFYDMSYIGGLNHGIPWASSNADSSEDTEGQPGPSFAEQG